MAATAESLGTTGAPAEDATDREILLTRQIAAEPASVWRAWTEPALIKRWFGPDCFEVVDTTLDLRPGGQWTLSLRGKDGGPFDRQAFDHHYSFTEVVPGQRLTMTEHWPDRAFQVSSALAPRDGGTLVTFYLTFASAADKAVAVQRGAQASAVASLDKLKALAETRPNATDLRISRVIPAPPARVFAAWTQAEDLKQWWGAHGATIPECEIDARPGGRLSMTMRDRDGQEIRIVSELRDVVAPTNLGPARLVMAMPFGEGEAVCTTTFEAVEGGTRVTSHWRHATAADCARHEGFGFDQGWDEMFKRLHAHVLGPGGIKDLRIERYFAAPRRLVWRAFADPAELAKWWGPAGFTSPTCRFEARPGGRVYIVMRGPDGSDNPMRGVVREAREPERLAYLAAPLDPAGQPYAEVLTVLTFIEEGEGTRLVLRAHAVALQPETLAMLRDEMAAGWQQSLDRLAAEVER